MQSREDIWWEIFTVISVVMLTHVCTLLVAGIEVNISKDSKQPFLLFCCVTISIKHSQEQTDKQFFLFDNLMGEVRNKWKKVKYHWEDDN